MNLPNTEDIRIQKSSQFLQEIKIVANINK
jgi:hypothetical protein